MNPLSRRANAYSRIRVRADLRRCGMSGKTEKKGPGALLFVCRFKFYEEKPGISDCAGSDLPFKIDSPPDCMLY